MRERCGAGLSTFSAARVAAPWNGWRFLNVAQRVAARCIMALLAFSTLRKSEIHLGNVVEYSAL
jgi:hypothetical protein